MKRAILVLAVMVAVGCGARSDSCDVDPSATGPDASCACLCCGKVAGEILNPGGGVVCDCPAALAGDLAPIVYPEDACWRG